MFILSGFNGFLIGMWAACKIDDKYHLTKHFSYPKLTSRHSPLSDMGRGCGQIFFVGVPGGIVGCIIGVIVASVPGSFVGGILVSVPGAIVGAIVSAITGAIVALIFMPEWLVVRVRRSS